MIDSLAPRDWVHQHEEEAFRELHGKILEIRSIAKCMSCWPSGPSDGEKRQDPGKHGQQADLISSTDSIEACLSCCAVRKVQ